MSKINQTEQKEIGGIKLSDNHHLIPSLLEEDEFKIVRVNKSEEEQK